MPIAIEQSERGDDDQRRAAGDDEENVAEKGQGQNGQHGGHFPLPQARFGHGKIE